MKGGRVGDSHFEAITLHIHIEHVKKEITYAAI